MTPDILRLLNAGMLLATTIPMFTAAIFFSLVFHTIGYGFVGKRLTTGFILLTASTLISAFNQLTEMSSVLVLSSQLVRFCGACFIASATIMLYKDTDENVP